MRGHSLLRYEMLILKMNMLPWAKATLWNLPVRSSRNFCNQLEQQSVSHISWQISEQDLSRKHLSGLHLQISRYSHPERQERHAERAGGEEISFLNVLAREQRWFAADSFAPRTHSARSTSFMWWVVICWCLLEGKMSAWGPLDVKPLKSVNLQLRAERKMRVCHGNEVAGVNDYIFSLFIIVIIIFVLQILFPVRKLEVLNMTFWKLIQY